jgi:hypothetical protein
MASQPNFEDLDRQIEALHEQLETCRQAIALSRAAIYGGGLVLGVVLTVAVAYRTPPVVLGAIMAILGGIVWLGANRSSREDLEHQLAESQNQRNQLFDEIAARNGWVDSTPTTIH